MEFTVIHREAMKSHSHVAISQRGLYDSTVAQEYPWRAHSMQRSCSDLELVMGRACKLTVTLHIAWEAMSSGDLALSLGSGVGSL